MLTAESNYSVQYTLSWSVEVHLSLNLKPNPKIIQSAQMKSNYGHIYRKVCDMHCFIDVAYSSLILDSAIRFLQIGRASCRERV